MCSSSVADTESGSHNPVGVGNAVIFHLSQSEKLTNDESAHNAASLAKGRATYAVRPLKRRI
jgi:hypothetical protein